VKKAQTFVLVNQILAAVDQAIDPQQVKETFNIEKTVPVKAAAGGSSSGGGGAAGDPGAGGDSGGTEQSDALAAARRLKASAPASTPIETTDDVEQLAAGVGKKALQSFGDRLRSTAEKAQSIEEFQAAVWEEYSSFDTTKLASATRDAIVTAEVIGRGEVAE
jgi:hypothetical protein